ncbi:potassium voltage-gated channel protein egl-36-like isoform X1 [Lineus longissimus]|uniref:potassium voltage-gated channel protein egl-36-like isoform X1 n=1 Tax=Lineus longissimus TaxID=88925 RepID=UPI002B4D6059
MDNHIENALLHDRTLSEEDDDTDLIHVNIRGTCFLTPRETILKISDSRLAVALNTQQGYNDKLCAYYFNREPDLFRIILQAHSQGEVHIPSETCAIEVLNEMEFWNIPRSMIAPCCTGKCTSAIVEKTIALTVREQILGNFEKSIGCLEESHGWRRRATELWVFLEFPVSSVKAKCWSVFMASMVILWTLFTMLMCDVNFRDPLSANWTHPVDVDDRVLALFKSEKWARLWLSPYAGNPYLIIDVFVTLIILFDLTVRIVTCTEKRVFYTSAKLVEVIVVFLNVTFQTMSVPLLLARIEITPSLRYMFLGYVSVGMLRPFLIIRLSNAFVGLRVLMMVLAKSATELVTIISFMVCGVLFFSVFIFLAELGTDGVFMSPWEGCWWSVITMSTVGYGDMYPHGWPGYVVGIFCTLSGIIITGLSIPILSGNFNSYYNHVHMAMAEIREYMNNNRIT